MPAPGDRRIVRMKQAGSQKGQAGGNWVCGVGWTNQATILVWHTLFKGIEAPERCSKYELRHNETLAPADISKQ